MKWAHLPVAGGLYDQHPRLLEDWNVIFAAKAEKAERDERERERKSRQSQSKASARHHR